MGRRKVQGILAVTAVAVAAALPAAATAAYPGANGRIAFIQGSWTGPSPDDIYTMDFSGGDRVQLTSGPENDSSPAYSADGETIVFGRQSGSMHQIWSMGHDGSDQVQLTSGASGDDRGPSISPDGRRIVFTRSFGSEGQIWVMNADGSGQAQLTFPGSPGEESFEPSYSPDGSKIVFIREAAPAFDREVWVMNSDGSAQMPLTSVAEGAEDYDPDFSPDGTRIVFTRYGFGPSSSYDNWIMNADGSGESALTVAGTSYDLKPVFTPDGTRVLFFRDDAASTFSNIFSLDPNGFNLGVTPLTSNTPPNRATQPVVQPLNPPSCDLSGNAEQKSTKSVAITVSCPAENATVVAEGTGQAPKPKVGVTASKKKKFTIPAVTATVQAGTPTTLTLAIPKKGAKALKRAAKAGRKGKATITTTLTDDLGQSSTETFEVRFKAKKKKKK